MKTHNKDNAQFRQLIKSDIDGEGFAIIPNISRPQLLFNAVKISSVILLEGDRSSAVTSCWIIFVTDVS